MNKWVAGLFIVLAILIIESDWSWARKSCREVCVWYDSGKCTKYDYRCTGSDDDEYIPSPDYGAIAYGKTKKSYGTSYKWPSRAKAESMALKKCGEYENDCEIAVWFKNKCGAVVTRSDNQLYYWGLGKSESEAKSVAMKECTKNNGRKCEVLIAQCANNK